MAIVETRDLTRHYRLGGHVVRAVDGVTLAVEPGEFVAMVGRSGSGKTTLLHLLGCLDRPTAGRVYVDGIDVGAASRRQLPRIRREKVGFVFQQFNLIPTLTAVENVMLPLRYARVPAGEARRRAGELLEQTGMGERTGHRPSALSGGEQQRVAIARALANRPAVVLADEPTGELDTETADTIVGLMRSLNETLGQTFVIVTHDPAIADQAGRIIRLRDGRIESDERR